MSEDDIMKRKYIFASALIMILIALTFASCDGKVTGGGNNVTPGPNPPVDVKNVSVEPISGEVVIHEKNIADFNFTTLFLINSDGLDILVQPSYLDLSHVPSVAGETGYVTCTYGGKTARCDITVKGVEYDLQLVVPEVTVNQLQFDEGCDFLEFFRATADGDEVAITKNMVTDTVKREPGDYTVTVSFMGNEKTLLVHMQEAHDVEAVVSYKLFEIESTEVATFDYKQLFSLYLDGVMIGITDDMLDTSALGTAEAGKVYEVTLTYSYKNENVVKKAKVRVIEPKTIAITAKNIVTYPNSGYIDLTTLFTITRGDEVIPVTIDMISGNIDYAKEGDNDIVLTYGSEKAHANVEVRRGVVIKMPKGDTIIVPKGMDKNAYSFASDFSVIINGMAFPHVDTYIDASEVDFGTVGVYPVTITIPYGYTPVNESATIKYVVVENAYTVNIVEEEVVLAKGTKTYNVLRNVSVRINGKNKVLTYDKKIAEADTAAVWVELLSEPVDFDAIGNQPVKLALYVNGVDAEPVTTEFTVRIKSDVSVTATGKVVFVGDTVFTRDLFSVKDGSDDIKVTSDMVEGKVDTLTPGVYTVAIDYLGLTAESKVVVLSDEIVGTYKTNMTTIPPEVDTDADTGSDDEYGYSDPEYYPEEQTSVSVLKDMVVSRDGTITVNGQKTTVVDGIDQSTIIVKAGTNRFTLHIDDGIVVVDPDNSLKMAFHDAKRPIVYFKDDVWELEERVTVNRGKNYVLSVTYSTFSIDTFHIKNIATGESRWFALYTRMLAKTSSDTVYKVTWGEGKFSDGFIPAKYEEGALLYEGIEYPFVMTDGKTAVMKTEDDERIFANMTFKGTINGVDARLTTDNYEAFTLKSAGSTIFSASRYDINTMVNGGPDYKRNTVFLYSYEKDVYSYKFELDTENKTFTEVAKDSLFGKYEYNGRFFFLDGYGTGIAKLVEKGYQTEKFAYYLNGNEVTIKFTEPSYDFAYGDTARFFVHPFGNLLTVKYMEGNAFEGAEFVNTHITTGAIIDVDTTRFEKGTYTLVYPKIYDAIHITTKDGELKGEAKESCIDLTKVKTGSAGFYQFTITLDIDGEKVNAYYALQILGIVYSGNPLVADYGKGVTGGAVSLSIDKYGQLTVDCGEKYVGIAHIADDNSSFYAKALNDDGGYIEVKGRTVADGLIFVRGTGAVSFSDYFTSGTASVAGGDGGILRRFTSDGKDVYMFALSSQSIGEVVSLSLISGDDISSDGAVVGITTTSGTIIASITKWGDATKGLLVADKYRGTYVSSEHETESVTIDGFGNFSTVTVSGNTLSGTYSINSDGTLLLCLENGNMRIIKADIATGTFDGVQFDFNAILSGKTFGASYIYTCENSDAWGYTAETTFVFTSYTEVKVASVSPEHDEGDDMCYADKYSPCFANESGMKGSYSIKGNKVTVTVGEAVFVFEIDDVLSPTELTCTSTTLSGNEHGYFKVGQKFYAQ